MGLICLCLKSCAKVVLFFETANVWEYFLRKMCVFSSFLLFLDGKLCFSMLFYVCGLSIFTGCLGVVLYLQSQKNVKKGGYKCGQSAFCWGSSILCPVAHLYKTTTSCGLYIFAWGGQGFISLLCVLLNLLHQHHILPSLFCAQPLLQHCALCKACFGE